jgi:hypothetical protein
MDDRKREGPSSPSDNLAPGGGPSFDTDAGAAHASAACTPDPKNAEIAANGCDDDGDGKVDDVQACDTGLAVDGDAASFARALGLCDEANKRGFGLVSATFSNGFGRTTPPIAGQWGILRKFGSALKPREGAALGVLSTGYAREFNSLRADDTATAFVPGINLAGSSYPTGTAPSGYPKGASGCKQDDRVNDVIDLKLTLTAPPNAQGFTFDFDFHSSEWPQFLCSKYNDAFIAYLSAKGFNGGKPDNISFDRNNNPVSVNNGFFDRCTSNAQVGCASDGAKLATAACPGGPAELAGTGFGVLGYGCERKTSVTVTEGGATGWLTTQAPVTPGETFTLEFLIWDTGDGLRDSLILLDHFSWVGVPVEAGTTRPPR